VLAKKKKTVFELEDEAEPVSRSEMLEWKKIVAECLKNNNDTVIKVLKLKNADFNRLTEAADALMSSGYIDVYTDKREKLAADIAKESSLLAKGSASRKRPQSQVISPLGDGDDSDEDERPAKRHHVGSDRVAMDDPEGDSGGDSE